MLKLINMDKQQAINMLSKDKAYEDKLVADLSEHYIFILDGIEDLEDKEIKEIREKLLIIVDESRMHSSAFNELIEMVDQSADNIF